MMVASDTGRPTVVLVGASNMTRSFAVLAELSARTWGAPLHILAAIGLGRSYGLPSSILGRRLPSVLDSGLWDALARQGGRREVIAIGGDEGNDLLYGQDVDTILRWVDECTRRLAGAGARIVLTSLPPGVVELSRPRFLLFRSVLFWRSPLRYEALPTAIPALNAGLSGIARDRGAGYVELQREWYGFDPIHIEPWRCRSAWAEIVAAIAPGASCPPVGLARSLRTFGLLAERQWFFGHEVRRSQPCLRASDGTTVSLY